MPDILQLINVTKIYEGGVLANHNINFSVKEGEIHALVGENGAGKSTLMKILYGMESITSGQMFLRGEEVKFSSSKDAIANGIGMVHQHFMLVDSFTGAENMMLGYEGAKFVINKKADIIETNELAKKYGFNINAERRVRDMGVSMKQKLEILKILYRGSKIIILDEPTAVLTPQETEELFERLLELKKNGFTLIFISHKLDEVKHISDRLTILKGGMSMGTHNTADLTEEEISNLMVGRKISFEHDKTPIAPGKELLRVENLNYMDSFNVKKVNELSMEVYENEIVGIAGVEGNGQNELVEIITGNLRGLSGKVFYKEHEITTDAIGDIRRNGISSIPEDRMFNGCAGTMSIEENIIAGNLNDFTSKGTILKKSKIKEYSKKLIKEFEVKTKDEKQMIKSLSGGNIQKAIVAREFSTNCDLLILNQPTRGIDVGAMSFIHHKIHEMRDAGKGILLVCADLSELIALSDRIIVMYKGKIVACLDNKNNVTEQDLGLYMLGIKSQKEAI